MAGKVAQQVRAPHIESILLETGASLSLRPGSMTIVVGPNNGGKSTFLNEISARVGSVEDTKWVARLTWSLGSEAEWQRFYAAYFRDDNHPIYFHDRITGNKVQKAEINNFYTQQTMGTSHFLLRMLNAQSRIGLADPVAAPDVSTKHELHPYHHFFYNAQAEGSFSPKIRAAFGKDFRLNKTGQRVGGHLGEAPKGARLSSAYEVKIIDEMKPIERFGDGVRSYVGILLNAISDTRPVTIIDEPEAFLHPPQARKLGFEMGLGAKETGRQVFAATHSADFIQGVLAAQNPGTHFLYLDHARHERPYFEVPEKVVYQFSRKPFLSQTNALDALFYDQVIICEGTSDLMFYKWALAGSEVGAKLDEAFWIASYSKAAIPAMLVDMRSLGLTVRCVFDLDVLLTPDILSKVCVALDLDFEPFKKPLAQLAEMIRVPPAAEALTKIEDAINKLSADGADDEVSTKAAIRAVKRAADSLGKSWVLKSSGSAAIPKGPINSAIRGVISEFSKHGVIILEEGEIENFAPGIALHGESWVRATIEANSLDEQAKVSLCRQFAGLR